MLFPAPLIPARLIRRYKRFLADVQLEDGTTTTAHTANSGSMLGCSTPGAEIWLSPASNPARTLKYTWELIRLDGTLLGINTFHPNTLVAEAVAAGTIPSLAGYDVLRREVRYGEKSRIDLLLESAGRPPCYVEVKNVTLFRDAHAQFPDAVTARGAKHLRELSAMASQGCRAVMVYVVQRAQEGLSAFSIAGDIDPAYQSAFQSALAAGVEVLCLTCRVSLREIAVASPLPLVPRF